MPDINQLPPAGWHTDPLNANQNRWWDGTGWSEKTAPKEPVYQAPARVLELTAAPSSSAPTGPISRRELRQQVGTLTYEGPASTSETPGAAPAPAPVAPRTFEDVLTTGETPIASIFATEAPAGGSKPGYAAPSASIFDDDPPSYEPMSRGRGAVVVESPEEPWGSSHTLPIWAWALSPIWGPALLIGALMVATWLLPTMQAKDINLLQLNGGIAAVSFFFILLWAMSDSRTLRDRGYRAPSAAWVFLPAVGALVYFIIRTARVGRGGLGPFLTWLILQVLVVGAVVALVVLASATITALTGQTLF